MSKEDQNLKIKKNTKTSNESMNKRDVVLTKTSQSLNTESYEYFNQNTTSQNNITESPYKTLNQQPNSRYSSINKSSNSKYISQNKSIQGKALAVQGNINLSGLSNHANENLQANSLYCTCPQNVGNKCTCGQFKKQIFEEKNSGQANYGYQLKNQQQISSSSNYISNSNNNYVDQNMEKAKTYQVGSGSPIQMDIGKSQTMISKNVIKYGSPNKQSLQVSQEMNRNISSTEKSKRIEGNICTCPKDMNNMGMGGNHERTNKFQNETYKYSKRIETTNVTNINKNTNTNRSYSYDNRIRFRRNKNRNIEWRTKCVGQNNESLQILSLGKPELIAQCVQDMQVIQEPKPVQILLPIQPNEIDYPLGLEIYGKNSEEEKKALKEAERLRRQMEIQPLKNEELNISKAYSTIEPHFENLNIDKKEQVFCDRQNKFKDINAQNQRKAFSVEHTEFGFHNDLKNKAWELISIENQEMNIQGGEKNFNKFNRRVLTTKMNVLGIYKPDWNDLNKAIKTTKMNIDGTPELEEPSEEKESEPEVIIKKVKKPAKPKKPKKQKKPVKKPVKKKPVKKIIKKVKPKVEEPEPSEEISESQNPELEIDNNYELELLESGRKFGPLKVQNKIINNYKGKEKPKIEEKPEKTKYEKTDVILDNNDIYTYEAEYPKNVDWNEDTIPMSGRPFTIEREPLPPLSETKAEKLLIKESYKTKDWNESIKERNEIKINMPKRKAKRQTILKERIKPVIIKGKETNWNKVIQKENDSKFQIDKCAKKIDFVLTKEKGVEIENEAEEILINDDYNIVEENHSRPIRANIRKIEDYTEESVSSEYDILKNIHRHESQFNQFKELVTESIKVNGQKVIINDISGKFPRRIEAFQGLDENFQKFANDQAGQKRRFNTTVKVNITKSVNRNIEQSEFNLKQNEDGGSYGFYSKKKIIEKQINNEPVQKKIYQFKSKLSPGNQQQRKVTYEPDQESKDNLNRAENGAEYYRNSEKRKFTQDQEENEENEEQGEQESQQPEDKDQNPQSKIKYVYTGSMEEEEDHTKIVGNHHHIEYVYEEEKSNSQAQEQAVEQEQEAEQEEEQEVEQEQEQEEEQYENQMVNVNQQGNYIVKEEIQHQPDGQIRKIQYIYKEENLQPGIQTQQIQTETHTQSRYQQKNYNSPQDKHSQIKVEINQNQINAQIQQQQAISQAQAEAQTQQKNVGSMGYNIKISQTQSPKDKGSPLIENKKKETENINVNVNVNKQENIENNVFKGEKKAYIKEITENEQSPEEKKIKLRYITLKKKEEKEETDSQPQDEQPQDEQPKENIQQQEIHEQQQVKIESQTQENIQEDKEEAQTKEDNTNKTEVNKEIKQENIEMKQNHEAENQADAEGENVEKEEEINNEEEQGQENEQEQAYEEEEQGQENEQEQAYEEEKEQEQHVEGEGYEQVEYDENQQEFIEGEEQVEGDQEHMEEEHIEGENEQIEVEEQEEQIEGDEEQVEEDVNENVPEDEQNENIQIGEGQEVVNDETKYRVSSVEEITGQKINQAFMRMQNPQTTQNITLASGVQISNLNSNRNQANANIQPQIRAQIIQTRTNNGNYINQVDIQREQLMRQSPVGIGFEQVITSSEVLSQEPQYGQNVVKNEQFSQNIQTSGSIKYDQNAQNRDPMMYSFGAKSVTTEGQNISGSGIKNTINLDNNDFLVSSITRQNNNINVSKQQGGVVIEKKIIQTTIKEVKNGSPNLENKQYGQMQIIGNQIGINTPTQISGSKREPVDGDSKKKQGEEGVNKEEISSFPLEPRDSRRKN